MYAFVFSATVLLAVVFGVAGMGKLLAGPSKSRKALVDFGVPQWLVAPVSVLLPVAELLTAILLLVPHLARTGSVAAFALLIIFSGAIAINLSRGKTPNCNCFGQLHSKPIGHSTLARNCAFAAMSAWLAWQLPNYRGQSLLSVVSPLSRAEILGACITVIVFAAIAMESFFILHVLRQNGRLLLRIEVLEGKGTLAHQPQIPVRPVLQGLPVGTKAIPFDLPKVNGSRATLDRLLLEGKPLLLISTDPNCGPCNSLMPEVANWQESLAAELSIVLLSHGRESDNRAKVREFGLLNVLLEEGHEIAEKYHALGTPTAVLIRADGTIGSPAMGGADGIRQLVTNRAWTETGLAELMKGFAQPTLPAPPKPTLPIGSPAPAFALTDLNGKTVESAQFNGNGTMLVFWNPACGFCQRMLPQLKEWEKSRPEKSPQLVLVSSGSREANRAMGLSSPVLIDDKFSVGQRYGASGTPSGSLIDKDGKIAAGLAVGEPTIMEILTGTKDKGNSAKVAVAGAS